MENKIMTVILIIIALIGIISIGYLLVKIVALLKAHKSVEQMIDLSPTFNLEKTEFSERREFSEYESTMLLGSAVEGKCSLGRLQFLKIGDELSTRIELLNKETIVLGRAFDVDISIEDNMISRKHLKLFYVNNEWKIQDLGSRNGTFLNGVRLTNSPVSVPSESVVNIGKTIFTIYTDV